VEGVELARRAAGPIDAGLHGIRHAAQMRVLGREVLERVDDRDQRPVEVGIGQAGTLDPGALERAGDALKLMLAAKVVGHGFSFPPGRALRRLLRDDRDGDGRRERAGRAGS